MPNGASQQFECVDKEQFKTKWLQTIYHVKCIFTQKQITRQNEKWSWFQRIKFLYTVTDERLTNLAMISIESQTAKSLDMTELTKTFAVLKSRKKSFS